MKISKVTILFFSFLLFLQGCAVKEEVIHYQASVKKEITTPIILQPITTPVVTYQNTDIFANAQVMKLPTLKNKIITIKGQDNLLKVTNPEYQNKEVLLYLFGRDCPHCVREIAHIKTLSKRPDLKVIGIHAQNMIGDATLKAYARKIGYNFDILSFKNDIIMIRYLRKSGLWYGGTPTHLLIDKGGNIQEISISELLNR